MPFNERALLLAWLVPASILQAVVVLTAPAIKSLGFVIATDGKTTLVIGGWAVCISDSCSKASLGYSSSASPQE